MILISRHRLVEIHEQEPIMVRSDGSQHFIELIDSLCVELDWRAWAQWLKLTYPTDYRGSGAKVHVSTFASVSGPIISEEKQREMQEMRRKLLSGEK